MSLSSGFGFDKCQIWVLDLVLVHYMKIYNNSDRPYSAIAFQEYPGVSLRWMPIGWPIFAFSRGWVRHSNIFVVVQQAALLLSEASFCSLTADCLNSLLLFIGGVPFIVVNGQ